MKKENFSSSWGFVLASAGSAIGLGNIWRFPYLCGQYGGLSFILVYLFILLFICNPLMVAEIAIGRAAQTNCVDAYRVLGSKIGMRHLGLWSFFGGWFAPLGVFLLLSFYFLVAGWVLYYAFEAVTGRLLLIGQTEFVTEFENLTQNFGQQYFCGLAFLLVTGLIVLVGVRKGIEKISLYLMPCLFFLFILLTIRAVTLDHVDEGIRFLLTIDLSHLGLTDEGFQFMPLFRTFTAALGQAFISLSLGFGILLVYGSYFSPKDNLFGAVRRIEFFDTMAALLSAFIIIPAVFSIHVSATSGPGLTFISLPYIFQKMSGGYVWSIIFYLLLMFATVTSTMSIFEVMTNLLMSKFGLKRSVSVLGVTVITLVGFTLVTLSYASVLNIKIFGRDLFTLFDWLSSTYTATIVSMTMALFVGYPAMKLIIHNIRRSAVVSTAFTRYFLVTLRYLAPFGLGLLLVMAIKSLF